ncbi:MAG: class I SAM-dependent methyltransferase [Peptococcales bacterium]|jgi:ubiquinone/menaquinone biosynthesis C-methylase UbiE
MKQSIWDFWANRYEKLWVQKYSLKPTRDLLIAELRKHLLAINLQENINLLDVGCGTGQLLEEIKENINHPNLDLSGIDRSIPMIAVAKKKHLTANLQIGDALDLPFSDSQFDIVTCSHSFPYYQDKLRALQEFKRVVKPGGIIFLIQVSENNLYDKLIMKLVKLTTGPAAYPSRAEIKEMVKRAGLNLVEQKKLENIFFVPNIILSILQNGDKNEDFISET